MVDDNINDILGIKNSTNQNTDNTEVSNSRYPALRTIAVLYLVFAWFIGFATLITIIYFLSEYNGKIFALITLIIGVLIALGLAAAAESIKVFLDIEYNTRKSTKK